MDTDGDYTAATASINQTGIDCSEERKPLCLRKIEPDEDIEEIYADTPASRRNRRRRRRRRKQAANKKRQALRWKQRKNKKSEKIGFVARKQGRQDECEPIEVCKI